VATIHDMIKEKIKAHHTLVHVFHVNALADNPWVQYRKKALDRQGRRSYYEIRSSVFKPTYEHKVPRPPRRPTCLCSSADVSAQ
jgi:hypothetical protein